MVLFVWGKHKKGCEIHTLFSWKNKTLENKMDWVYTNKDNFNHL